MAKGMPRSQSTDSVAPLTVKRLENVPIIKIGAFQSVAEKEDRTTKEKYEVKQVNLSIDFDSGHKQRTADGEEILDNAGDPVPHLINLGFVTLSGHFKATLTDVLKAIGFDEPRFLDDEGSLNQETIESLEAEFGTNGLGDSYEGCDWTELPFYVTKAKGGTLKKREVEVPVTSLKIGGYEVLGRTCDLSITIKDGWNRVSAFIPPREEIPLDAPRPAKRARGVPKVEEPEDVPDPLMSASESFERKADANRRADPLTEPNPGEPAPESKAAIYVTQRLQEAGVPGFARVATLNVMTGDFDTKRIFDTPNATAKTFQQMFKADPTTIAEAYEAAEKQGLFTEPTTADLGEEDFDDEDFA